jgi:hypothetical protein
MFEALRILREQLTRGAGTQGLRKSFEFAPGGAVGAGTQRVGQVESSAQIRVEEF